MSTNNPITSIGDVYEITDRFADTDIATLAQLMVEAGLNDPLFLTRIVVEAGLRHSFEKCYPEPEPQPEPQPQPEPGPEPEPEPQPEPEPEPQPQPVPVGQIPSDAGEPVEHRDNVLHDIRIGQDAYRNDRNRWFFYGDNHTVFDGWFVDPIDNPGHPSQMTFPTVSSWDMPIKVSPKVFGPNTTNREDHGTWSRYGDRQLAVEFEGINGCARLRPRNHIQVRRGVPLFLQVAFVPFVFRPGGPTGTLDPVNAANSMGAHDERYIESWPWALQWQTAVLNEDYEEVHTGRWKTGHDVQVVTGRASYYCEPQDHIDKNSPGETIFDSLIWVPPADMKAMPAIKLFVPAAQPLVAVWFSRVEWRE